MSELVSCLAQPTTPFASLTVNVVSAVVLFVAATSANVAGADAAVQTRFIPTASKSFVNDIK